MANRLLVIRRGRYHGMPIQCYWAHSMHHRQFIMIESKKFFSNFPPPKRVRFPAAKVFICLVWWSCALDWFVPPCTRGHTAAVEAFGWFEVYGQYTLRYGGTSAANTFSQTKTGTKSKAFKLFLFLNIFIFLWNTRIVHKRWTFGKFFTGVPVQ